MSDKFKKVYELIAVIVICVSLLFGLALAGLRLYFSTKYEKYVESYSTSFNLDKFLVYAIIKQESNFKSDAVSSKGAVGLMQIMPTTAEQVSRSLGESFDENNLYDPKTNIRYGCFYLQYLFQKFETVEEVLFAYNAGEGTLILEKENYTSFDEILDNYPSVKKYVKNIKNLEKMYKNLN